MRITQPTGEVMPDEPDRSRDARLHGLQLFFELGNYPITRARTSGWHRITPAKRAAWELRYTFLPIAVFLTGCGVTEVGSVLDSTPVFLLGLVVIVSVLPCLYYTDRIEPKGALTPALDGYVRTFKTERTTLVEALLKGLGGDGSQTQHIEEQRGVRHHTGFEMIALRREGVDLYVMVWSHHGATALHLGPLRYPLRPAVEEVRGDIDRIAIAAGIS